MFSDCKRQLQSSGLQISQSILLHTMIAIQPTFARTAISAMNNGSSQFGAQKVRWALAS